MAASKRKPEATGSKDVLVLKISRRHIRAAVAALYVVIAILQYGSMRASFERGCTHRIEDQASLTPGGAIEHHLVAGACLPNEPEAFFGSLLSGVFWPIYYPFHLSYLLFR